MKIHPLFTILGAAIILVLAANHPALRAQQSVSATATPAPDGGWFRGAGRFWANRHPLARLNLSNEQKAAGLAVIHSHQPAIKPLVDNLVKERFALRTMFKTPTIDESAIRAQSAKIAVIEADLAVQKAYLIHDLRAIATPEQLRTLDEMQSEAEDRIDNGIDRINRWIETR